jgi:hypothetical protein
MIRASVNELPLLLPVPTRVLEGFVTVTSAQSGRRPAHPAVAGSLT